MVLGTKTINTSHPNTNNHTGDNNNGYSNTFM